MIRKNAKLGDPPFFAKVEMDQPKLSPAGWWIPTENLFRTCRLKRFPRPMHVNFEASSWFNTKSDDEGKIPSLGAKGGPSVFWIVPEKLAPKQIVSGTKRGDFGDVQIGSPASA